LPSGDQAITNALDALECAQLTNGKRDSRHHIAHIQVPNPNDLSRFKELDVCANFQPLWAGPDDNMLTLTLHTLGADRSLWQYPIRTLLDTGAKVGFGSDWFVSSVNPLDGIQTAVTHNLLDSSRTPWRPDQCISLAQAIHAYTLGSAYINFLDDICGSIVVGKKADLVILDQNLFEIPPSQIHTAKVLATYVGGRLVYEAT